ncbi:MAG: DUF551 domain-containing protein [Proteobacteria bacterium]|nr:DUF551 domain-containing protein [Pseudomonadota bacterium]
MKTNTEKLEWTETKDQMPEVGQKVVVFVWRDEAVYQAWWNGEHYVLVAANEEGKVTIYEVLPIAISHWQQMPETPVVANAVNNNQWEYFQASTIH